METISSHNNKSVSATSLIASSRKYTALIVQFMVHSVIEAETVESVMFLFMKCEILTLTPVNGFYRRMKGKYYKPAFVSL
jgi:hypothetical protein